MYGNADKSRLSELSSRKQQEGWRIWLAKWCKIHKVYIYSHSTTKFTFKKYIYSHLRDVFIHIQWVIFVHIHNQNVHSPFSGHHLCASLGPSTRSIISAQCNVADTVNDLINAHSQINAPYLIDTPLEVYSLF